MISRTLSVKKTTAIISFIVLFAVGLYSQTTIISSTGNGGFEAGTTFAANGWTVVNGGTNQWVCNTGATAGFSGTRCAYISNNTAGTPPTHTYTNTAAGAVHMYRDVTFPSGETGISFSFSIRMTGESGWDRLLVYISNAAPGAAPVSGTPASNGTALAGYTLLSTQGTAASWTSRTVAITAAQAGNASGASNRRILFVWQNDNSAGSNPPVAIDNISLISQGPPANDNCAGAVALTPGAAGAACSATSGTTQFATQTSAGCFGTADDDVWYSFVATGTSHTVTVTGAASFDAVFQVFSGSCGGTSVICEDDNGSGTAESAILTGLTAGNTYWIRVYHYAGTASSTPTFTICITTPNAPPANDGCAGAISLTPGATCVYTAGTSENASQTLAGCDGTADDDVWFSFVASGPSQVITVAGAANYDAVVQVFSGSCGGTSVSCTDDIWGGGGTETVALTGLTTGNTYWIRVYHYDAGYSSTPTFNICIVNPCPAGVPSNDDCSGATVLTMNSYGSCASTSAGNVACATASTGVSIGSCFGNPDDDIWYQFVATSTQHYVTLTTTSGFDAYMQLFSGTCTSLTSLGCSDPNSFTVTGLTIGQTYYIRVSSYATGAPSNGNIALCVAAPPTCPASLGTAGVDVFNVTLPYSSGATTTCGAGNNVTNTNAVICSSSNYYTGEDVVYYFTPASSGQVTITLTSTGSYTGIMFYEGCPFSGTCINQAQSSSGNKSICVSVVSGITYYLVVDSWSAPSCNPYSLTITSPSSGIPNDLPCNAISLTLGTSVNGDNTCTAGSGEPAAASCWTGGSLNTVWYSFVAASSGINIQTTLGTISNTQIALYSGTCGASLTEIACNTSVTSGCEGTATNYSMINATGLVAGTTYYIRVDGRNSNVGTFSIVATDGISASGSPVPGQDCLSPIVLCSSTMTIGNPGYSNEGNICDFTGSGNCTSGELNSVWYQINIGATGNFNFTLMPNDGSNSSCGTETDYDFLLWKVSGTGTTTNCSSISSSSGTALLSCNFDSYGVTGISSGGTAPSPINSCFNWAFEPTVSVTAGDVLYLVIQNYSGSTQGFTVDFTSSGAGVVNYTAPTTVYWTGGASTAWQNPTNWGSCATYPICGVNAVVTAASTTQPNITGTEYVKDLTINPGSTLTLGPGAILHICGSFTNNGTFTADPTSTVIFDNTTGTQTINGSFTGGNKFGNLTVTKGSGMVTANCAIDIGANFTTSNSSSIFNSNNQYIKVAGNFVNATGNTTYTTTGSTGILEFNGTAAQTYNQGSSQLDLNTVIMNHTGTGVTLQTDMNIKAVSGNLTLTLGKIITTATYKVIVSNSATTAVTTGNTSSYVHGFLRRYINNSTGSFDFPVGTSTAYQRVNINFTAAPVITYLTADFQTYVPGPPGPLGSGECSVTYDMNALDNGFWNIEANTANNNTGTYTMTLYNTAYTNAATSWTVMSRHNGSATWDLVNGDGSSGTCVVSPVTAVSRANMRGFSRFGNAQASTPLPIELLSFSGKNEGNKNRIDWATASETNNAFFNLERSQNGSSFESFIEKEGAGNSSVKNDYHAYDYSPFNGITYYRLKQTDYDGKFTYSSTILIENKLDQITVTNVHPNPTTDNLHFDFFSPISGVVKIQVLDLTGRVILDKLQNIEEGKSNLNTQISGLAKGIYSLNVEFSEGDFKFITKIVKY